MVAARSDRVKASTLLAQALDGPLVHGDVNEAAYPFSARSYFADGGGVAWLVPERLREQARFALDVEASRPVRPSLQRRFGITDPQIFVAAWTQAEVCAKLLNIPIVVWLKKYGLSFDLDDVGYSHSGEIALLTRSFADELPGATVTFGVFVGE